MQMSYSICDANLHSEKRCTMRQFVYLWVQLVHRYVMDVNCNKLINNLYKLHEQFYFA